MEISALNTMLRSRLTAGMLTLDSPLFEAGLLAAFLPSLPARSLTLQAVNLTFYNTAPLTLLIEGTVREDWILTAVNNATLSAVKIRIRLSQMAVGGPVTDSLAILASTLQTTTGYRVNLQGDLRTDNRLYLRLLRPDTTKQSLAPIIKFANVPRLGILIPPLPLFQNVLITDFELAFGFTATASRFLQVSSLSGSDWPITADISIRQAGVAFTTETSTPQVTNDTPSFHGHFFGTLHIGQDFGIVIRLQSPGLWELEVMPADGNLLPGLQDLAGLAGQAELQKTIQDGLKTIGLDQVSIDDVKIGFDFNAKKLRYVLMRSHIMLFGVRLNVFTALPDFQLAGAMAPGSKISLKYIISQHFAVSSNFPEVDVTELSAAIFPNKGIYSLGITVTDTWAYEISAGRSLALTSVTADIQKAPTGITGEVTAMLAVAGADMSILVAYLGSPQGWHFKGSTGPGQAIAIGDLMQFLGSTFGTTVTFPSALVGLTVHNLDLDFISSTSDFVFTCGLQFPVQGQFVDMTVNIALTHVDGKFEKIFKGQLLLADLQFDLNFDTGGVSTAFWGDYQNPGGGKITISELVQLLTPDAVPGLDGLSFNVKDAFAGYYKGAGAADPAKWLLGLDMDFGADLSALPLVGKYVPKEEALRLVFQPRIATQQLLPADVTALRAIVPAGITLADSFEPGVTLQIELNMGSTAVPINLPIGAQSVQPTGQAPTITAGTSSPAPALADKATWFSLQKSFGPLHLQRVGVQYENSLLTFLLDGGFSIAGLTLSLNGLSASTRLNPFALSFDLQGLGLDFKGGAVEIGAAFLKEELTDENNVKYTAYDGMAIIRAAQFSLSAIGSYAEYQGHPSMFLYAVLDSPIGGPAFFFVTGLAAGFGYNRALRVPTIDQVQQFPLVAQAIAGVPNSATDIGTQIRSLHTYIPPAVGEYFLAVGIKFTSFKLIESFALLIVSFGKSLEIDLLGISTLVLPAPQEGNVITPLAEVQLALKASYLPEVGFLGVEAKLTSASYLFSRACHLTGGFAFYTWFAGAHKDEFVLTIGGYHPSYQRPAHYPNVDKLGFNWVINSNMSIKGDAYFALVPSAVMAGVHLNALWQDGSLSAWFNAGADFIMSWQPYHYDARVYVDIGVSYTYHFFGTHHITAEAGADLHIWGPEFTGTAHVHLWIVTFDVNFGSSSSAAPGPVSWPAFTKAFLPKPAEVCGLAVVKGLEKKKEQTADASAELVINPKELLLSFNSLIPLKSAHQKGDSTKELVPSSATTNWGIGPMGLAAGAVTSKAVLEITRTHEGKQVDMAAYFTCTPAQKGVPVALWGQTVTPSLNGRRLIENVVCGFDIGAAPPAAPAETSFIDRDKLQFSLDEIASPQWRWAPMSPFGSSPAARALNDTSPVQENTRRAYLRDHLTTGQDQRTRLLQQLGFATPVFFNNSVADAFTVAPQVAEVLP